MQVTHYSMATADILLVKTQLDLEIRGSQTGIEITITSAKKGWTLKPQYTKGTIGKIKHHIFYTPSLDPVVIRNYQLAYDNWKMTSFLRKTTSR